MQTLSRPLTGNKRPIPPSPRRKRFSPLVLVSAGVTLAILLSATVFLVVIPYAKSRAAAVNMDCSLIVPPDPLSARGLATPYQLVATDPANGPCNEATATQAAFVQGAVIDPASGKISAYNPLVVDKGAKPAIAPVVPKLPRNGVVALWFGFNGGNLTLQDKNDSLHEGRCVNGVNGSIFGQFSYCNAPAFFAVANLAIQAGKLVPPALGMGNDGNPCPTVRDFSVVDQDQSDNVTTTYLLTANGQTAQMTAAAMAALQNTKTQTNGSDNRLLAIALDGALGCTPWTAPDLADPGNNLTSLPLNELLAAARQMPPVAFIPANDPMVLNNNNVDVNKINAYRVGVDQPRVANADAASPTTYCQNLVSVGAPRIVQDAPLTVKRPPADAAVGNTLFTFLAQRFVNTYGADNLNCTQLLGKPSPIQTTQDGNGVAISATFNGQPINTQAPGTTPTPGATTPNCNVNGTVINGCSGQVKINGQTCKLSFANNTVSETCQGTQGGGNNGGPIAQNPLPFNNKGASDDMMMSGANFDGVGFSYSVQAMQGVGLTQGKTIIFNGVNFVWPSAAAGTPDNVQAAGQTIPITPVQKATTLAFLGSASFGPSVGIGNVTYTDGTQQKFVMAFSDWTLNAARSQPAFNNQDVSVMSYRNFPAGMQMQKPHVFYTDVALQAGKTIKSVTLPARANRGQLHVFAISTK